MDDTKGVLSDNLYLHGNKKDQDTDLKEIIRINHCKNHIIFLHNINDATVISEQLFPFVREIISGFFSINCRNLMHMCIVDPVMNGRPFNPLGQALKDLSIESGASDLIKTINNNTKKISSMERSIDDYNRKMYENDEDDVKLSQR